MQNEIEETLINWKKLPKENIFLDISTTSIPNSNGLKSSPSVLIVTEIVFCMMHKGIGY